MGNSLDHRDLLPKLKNINTRFMLKRIITLFLLSLTVTTLLGQLRIVGKISSPQSDEIAFQYKISPVQMEPFVEKAEIASNGSFELELNLESPQMVTLRHGEQLVPLYLFPTGYVELRAKGSKLSESIEIEGAGGSIASSRFLKDWMAEQESRENLMATYDAVRNADNAQEALTGMLERQDIQRQKWESAREKGNLPTEFIQFFDLRLTYQQANTLSELEAMYRYFHDGEEFNVENPDQLTNMTREVPLLRPEAVNISQYLEFVDNQLNKRLEDREYEDPKDYYAAKFEAIESLDGAVKVAVKAKLIADVLSYGNPIYIEEAIHSLPEEEGGQLYYDMLLPAFEKAMELAPGRQAPHFKLMSAEGEEFNLKDLQGKLVYVDFWASWCGPCLAEMPYTRELIEQYQEHEGIAFLFISIDDDEEAWRQAMEEENIPGIHVWSQGFNSEVPQAYNVSAIPNYFLIAPDGTILDPFPPRPSSGQLGEIFEKNMGEGGR